MANIKIRNIEAEEGSKSFGFIDVDKSSTTMYRIPLAIINGSKNGPTLTVLGGVHGLEYSSIEAVIRLIRNVDPKSMNGILLAVPVVNQASFEARSAFISPLDKLNQNRCFPGDPKGTMSYRVANTLFNEIVSKAEYLIDCHGGDLTEDIYDFVTIGISDRGKVDKTMLDMAALFNTKYVIKGLQTDIKGEPITGSTMTAANIYGIPAITIESGRGGIVRESSVAFIYKGLMNVMRYLGMIEGKPDIYEYKLNPEIFKIKAEKGGIFHPKVGLGKMVSAGDIVVEVTDLFGKIIQTVTAPDDSMVAFLRTFYCVNPGEPLIWLVKIE